LPWADIGPPLCGCRIAFALFVLQFSAPWWADARYEVMCNFLEVSDPARRADVILVLGTGDSPRLACLSQLPPFSDCVALAGERLTPLRQPCAYGRT
jgi:hypothetical protein